ncbi:MAG: dihydrodipicolinate synthase family protein [Spirochaetota bacterium]
MESIKEKLSGVFAPIVTPFEDDEILFDGLVKNIEKMNKTGLRGYFVLGTNGEFKSLSVEERMEVLKVVVGCASKDKVIMAGTSAESTKETIRITMRAIREGAHMVSLLMPSFFAKRMDDDVLTDYILSIAEESPVPVLVYNNPSVAAGINISPEVVRRVSGHPMVAGMKDSSRGNFIEYLKAAEEGFYVLAGSASFFLELLKAGGIGGVLSLANVFPDDCVRLYRAFIDGREEEAQRISSLLVTLNKEVSGTYGVAGVKAAMDIVGYTGGLPRRPLRGLSKDQKEDLKKKILTSGFLKGS